ncbi:MAG: phosphodiester glycosidase family protein [bacterium]|nr:phosphodiester glycosidase family protein [bacterium]
MNIKMMRRYCKTLLVIFSLLSLLCRSGFTAPRHHILNSKNFSNSSKVYIIQDLHADEKSQAAISRLIEYIASEHPNQTVNIYREGAQGVIFFEWFRTFPDKTARETAADYFAKTGKISGAEYTAITSDTHFYLYGIDDSQHYHSNLSALNSYLSGNDRFTAYSRQLNACVEQIVSDSSNAALQSFLLLQKNAVGLNPLEYYFRLASIYCDLGIVLPPDSALHTLQESYGIIVSTAPQVVESQKLFLLKSLYGDQKALTVFAEHRSESDYLRIFNDYTDKGFPIDKIHELHTYLQAHDTLKQLDAHRLPEEKFTAVDFLFRNKKKYEANVCTAILCNALVPEYFNCTLTRPEYDFLTRVFSDASFQQLTEALPQLALLSEVKKDIVSDNFYSSALARDGILAKNIVEQIHTFPDAVHIAVIGGFHTNGITEVLSNESISYETLLPAVNHEIEGYEEKYYSLLGIHKNTAEQNSLIEKLYATFNTPVQYLAVPTYLKHILSESASDNFVLEAQFLMQGLHAFSTGHDIADDAYPFKALRFLDPLLINGDTIFPVIFDNLNVPPLFVRIAYNDTDDFGTPATPLHTTHAGKYHIAVVGPEWFKNIFSISNAAISLELISYDSQKALAHATAPYLAQYTGIAHTVEKTFELFDENLHFRKYSVSAPRTTMNGLLSPTTVELYRNGPVFLGTLHKSGDTADKSGIFLLRRQLNQMAQEWLELFKERITDTQRMAFLQAVSYIFTLRSNRTLKNPTDFSIAFRGLDEQSGDRHLRYFEHLTSADMRGLLQKIFTEMTGISNSPYFHKNQESLAEGLEKTKLFFESNEEAALQSLVGFAPLILNSMLSPDARVETALLSPIPAPAINDTDRLYQSITDANTPYGMYPDTPETLAYDLTVFGERALIERLRSYALKQGIAFPETVTSQSLADFFEANPEIHSEVAPVYLFVKENPVLRDSTLEHVETLLADPFFSVLSVLRQFGIFRIQSHNALSEGFSLVQMPDAARDVLREIQAKNGFLITRGETHYFSANLMNIDSFRMLTVSDTTVSDYLTLNIGDTIGQFIPAGLAPVIGYGFIQQTAQEFSAVLASPEYKALVRQFGNDERYVLSIIRERFQKSYLPISRIVESLLDRELYDYGIVRAERSIEHLSDGNTIFVNRVRLPGSGAIKIDIWRAESEHGDSLDEIYEKYRQRYPNRHVFLLSNGGFFITSTLINRQNLPSQVLGTNLGLSMRNGRILSPPLFNKTALFQTTEGTLFLHKATINRQGGIWPHSANRQAGFSWKTDTINLPESALRERHESLASTVLLYTPLFDHEFLPESALKDRVIIQIAGNTIANVAANPLEMKHLFAGITLAVPEKQFARYAEYYAQGTTVEFELNFDFDVSHVQSALEAGPGLLRDGQPLFETGTKKINLDGSGWLTKNSQKTQESRVHDMDMRYSRTSIGLAGGELIVIAVDGRIQESSGVTHGEMAEILQKSGATDGFALDGGGSVALYLPHLKNPAFNNNAWNPYNATDDAPLGQRRKSMARPLSTAIIYYMDEEQLPKPPAARSITPSFRNPLEQSL